MSESERRVRFGYAPDGPIEVRNCQGCGQAQDMFRTVLGELLCCYCGTRWVQKWTPKQEELSSLIGIQETRINYLQGRIKQLEDQHSERDFLDKMTKGIRADRLRAYGLGMISSFSDDEIVREARARALMSDPERNLSNEDVNHLKPFSDQKLKSEVERRRVLAAIKKMEK